MAMTLQDELHLKKPISLLAHEALLSTYYSASQLRKKAGEFLRPFGLTDVQFNLMMLLRHQSGNQGGLNQAQISNMMLVNRANITAIIDRMEKAGLVVQVINQNVEIELTDEAITELLGGHLLPRFRAIMRR